MLGMLRLWRLFTMRVFCWQRRQPFVGFFVWRSLQRRRKRGRSSALDSRAVVKPLVAGAVSTQIPLVRSMCRCFCNVARRSCLSVGRGNPWPGGRLHITTLAEAFNHACTSRSGSCEEGSLEALARAFGCGVCSRASRCQQSLHAKSSAPPTCLGKRLDAWSLCWLGILYLIDKPGSVKESGSSGCSTVPDYQRPC